MSERRDAQREGIRIGMALDTLLNEINEWRGEPSSRSIEEHEAFILGFMYQMNARPYLFMQWIWEQQQK